MADELATLPAELAEDMLLDATDIAVDMVDDADMVADPVAVELPTTVAVWPAVSQSGRRGDVYHARLSFAHDRRSLTGAVHRQPGRARA